MTLRILRSMLAVALKLQRWACPWWIFLDDSADVTYPRWGFCWDCGVRGTTREVSLGATSSCPGIHVQPATTTAATTAKHALKSKAYAPLSNSRNTKGHTAGSCHPLPDSLPSFPPPSPNLSAHFLTIGANHFPPLTSSATNAERQSVTRALGDATLPAAFRTLR